MGAWTKEPTSLLPTAEPTKDDVLFFAGFYEGEGSVCRQKGNACIVQVPQKDPEVLYRARALWGGSIRVNSRGVSVWVMSGDRARLFLIAIYPFLSARRKRQVEDADGLKLSGKKMLEQSGMTQERALARAAMTPEQRHKETADRWAASNKERKLASTRAWMRANREHVNTLQRERRSRLKLAVTQNQTSERSALVN